MAKAWRAVVVIVLVIAIIGSVLLMVGVMTGADFTRTFHTIAEKYGLVDDIGVYVEYFRNLPAELWKSASENLSLPADIEAILK